MASRIRALEQRVAELEEEIEEFRSGRKVRALQAEIDRVRKGATDFFLRSMKDDAKKHREFERLKKMVAELDIDKNTAATITRLSRQIERLTKKLAKAEADLEAERVFKEEYAGKFNFTGGTKPISKSELNKLRRAVHPDTASTLTERERTEAAQILNTIEFPVGD